MIDELDCVVLTTDTPEYGLAAGDMGTVVMVHEAGRGFEVEFVAPLSAKGFVTPSLTFDTKLYHYTFGAEPYHGKSKMLRTGQNAPSSNEAGRLIKDQRGRLRNVGHLSGRENDAQERCLARRGLQPRC